MAITNNESQFFDFVHGSSSLPVHTAKKILIEGDSWASHPLVGGSLNNQVDTLGGNNFAILDLSQPGDEAAEMLKPETRQRWRLDRLTLSRRFSFEFDMVVLSAGGNDIIGSNLVDFVNTKSENPNKYGRQLVNGEFDSTVSQVVGWYKEFLDALSNSQNKEAKVVSHCYAYLTPRPVGTPVFGIPFGNGEIFQHLHRKGIEDVDEMYDVISYMLRYFRDQLLDLQNGSTSQPGYKNFAVADTLEVLLGNDGKPNMALWYDEVHPNSEGFRRVAKKIRKDARKRNCWPD